MASITIASVTIPGWQGNSSGVQLRIYTNQSFTAASGTIYPKSVTLAPSSLGTFFQSYTCSVSAGSLIIPAVTLDSTVDSPDNPNASYSAVLFDSQSGKQIQSFGTFAAFSLNPSPTSTTWAAIFTADADS
jgi:hypothetical protein